MSMADGDGLQPPRGTDALVRAIGDEVFQKLRVESPPKPSAPAVDWLKIAPYVCVLLTIVSTILGAVMWRQIDQIGEASKLAAANDAAIERIDKDRTARIARTDARFDSLDRRTNPIDLMVKDISRLETISTTLDSRLVQGREERLADTTKMVDSLNALRTEVALLRQEQQQLRQSVEARNRAQPPFLENPTWSGRLGRSILRASSPLLDAVGRGGAPPLWMSL